MAQFQEMVRLAPNEPVSHYQLGVLYKMKEDYPRAIAQFETARDLSPRLAAPHFQLYGLYRQAGRAEQAAAELKIFQDLKKQQEGAAIPEDMDWCAYAELYDPIDAPPRSTDGPRLIAMRNWRTDSAGRARASPPCWAPAGIPT
jgi:tetratricopeptide (TPR) repeat protein